MTNNTYWNKAIIFKKILIDCINQILSKYNNELKLFIENINLLSKDDNCIQTSTAIGFCLEEFIVSQLIDYTNKNDIGFEVKRFKGKTTIGVSYDCYAFYDSHLFLINFKANKSNNDAVAAINKIYQDYVEKDAKEIKHYFILKLDYSLVSSKIKIENVDGYYLEEIDFSKGYKQDHRNWSNVFKAQSGRLLINSKFIKEHQRNKEDISFENTKKDLIDLMDKLKKK